MTYDISAEELIAEEELIQSCLEDSETTAAPITTAASTSAAPTTAVPLTTAASTTVAPTSAATARSFCPSSFSRFAGSCYLITPESKKFGKGSKACEAVGGSLAKIETEEENAALASKILAEKNLTLLKAEFECRSITLYTNNKIML